MLAPLYAFVQTYQCFHLQVEFPSVVETYYNHGGVQFKCYVIGSEVHCVKKLSIPNVTCSTDNPENANRISDQDGLRLVRDLLIISPHGLQFDSLKSAPVAQGVDLSIIDLPDNRTVQECANVIRRLTGLSIFGFDLICPSKEDGIVLIDVNAFPSYKGIPSAPQALRTLVLEITEGRLCTQ